MAAEQCQQMGQVMGGMMSGMMGNAVDGGMMWGGFGWFGLIALAVILVVGVALAFAFMRRPVGDEPREILRRRFARGELSSEEFTAAQKALG